MHEKILLSSFTVKAETRSIDKFSKRFLSLIRFVFSTIFIQNYDITSVSPIIQDISKFINLYKNSFGHLSSFTSRVPHWKTQAAPIVDVISESIVSHFSSFLSCVLTEQWVNFTAAYVTFENTSPSLSLSLHDPTAMILHHFDLYTQQPYRGYDDLTMMSSSHWRHHHSLTWPLRTTSFLYSLAPSLSSSRSSSRPSQLLRALYLFRKLNGRVLSHSCGYSFRQRAWPSFQNIRISRISRDTVDSQFLKGIPSCYRSTRSSLSILDEISRLFSDIDFSSLSFSNIISFFIYFFLFLFIGLLGIGRDRK